MLFSLIELPLCELLSTLFTLQSELLSEMSERHLMLFNVWASMCILMKAYVLNEAALFDESFDTKSGEFDKGQ